MAFESVYDLTTSLHAAFIAAIYIIFGKFLILVMTKSNLASHLNFLSDVGMITLNQYILLDPPLLFFMTASVMGMVKVTKFTTKESFTRKWWLWLFFTGTMISCTISVKFVGLFVVLLVGFHTVNDLWNALGDIAKPVVS